MKAISLFILISAAFINIQAQNFVWAKKGGLWAYDYGYGVTTDRSGNVYVVGKYEQNANFSGVILPCQGNHDIFVAQYSPTGNLNWIRTAGGYSGDYAWSVACDGNFLYVTGEIEGVNALIKFSGSPITLTAQGSNDVFLAKYTLSGTLLWARRAGSPNYEKGLSVTYDHSGGVYISGLYTNTITFGGTTTLPGYGDVDAFLAKYDANGNFIWARRAGGAGRDEAKCVKCDAAGNVYICGMYKYSADFSGQTVTTPDTYWNAYLAKYSSSGALLWVRTAGTKYDDLAWSLTIDNAGKIYITGEYNSGIQFGGLPFLSSSGQADVFVACYDANGNAIWSKKAGGNQIDRARGIGTDGNKLFITGQFGGTATFGSTSKSAVDNSDIFMSCLSNNGNFLWTSAVGGPPDAPEDLGYESGIAICAEPSGNVYATGATLTGGSFGSTFLSGYSRTDVFITKLFSPALLKERDTTETASARDTVKDVVDGVVENKKTIFDENLFKLYPNPGTSIFTLEIGFEYNEPFEVSISNSVGELVEKIMLTAPSKTTIDLSGKETGFYFVDMVLGDERKVKKIVLE